MSRILWFEPASGVSENVKFVLTPLLKTVGLGLGNIIFAKVGSRIQDIQKYIHITKPKMIVINCEDTLRLFHHFGTLDQCRGGIYNVFGITAICINDLRHIHTVKHGRWLLVHDFSKMARWLTGKQRTLPQFNIRVCRTLHDIIDACEYLSNCLLFSTDIETAGGIIRCIGYYGLNKNGTSKGFVIPFHNAFKSGKCHWSEEDEIFVWDKVRKLHESPPVKILQNGAYDQAWMLKYRCPITNNILDPMHLWHTIYCELPKKINFIASVVLDHYRFWKDEGKGTAEEKKKSEPRFKTEESQERYWRYCGLDNYYTLWSGFYLSQLIVKEQMSWALYNFIDEMLLQFGPAQEGSMKGFKLDVRRVEILHEELYQKASKRLAEIRIIADHADFNPSSAKQYASLLYDVLKAKPMQVKGKTKETAKANDGKSTDEKILKHIARQHPILKYVIEKVFDYKKPLNNISKYCITKDGKKLGAKENESRFLYQLNAGGTETTRFSGNNHQFWCGTNPQNVPMRIRHMLSCADTGYIIFEPDYKQSDAKFVAYESEDPNYIEVMERKDFDTHAYHCAHFFKQHTYAEIIAGIMAGNEYFSGEPTGIRYITKRIVHGGNYDMAGWTLYITMGHAAAVACANALGHKDAFFWTDKQFAQFLQGILNSLWKLYPRVPEWKKEEIERALKNNNKVTNCFGRTRLMIGDLKNDKALQRELIAFLGQSATGGNINRALRRIHYGPERHDLGIHFATQTHDSMKFFLPVKNFHECAKFILTIMEEPVTVKGRSMFVQADAKIGFSWGRGLVKYKNSLTLEELMDHELNLQSEWRVKKRRALENV